MDLDLRRLRQVVAIAEERSFAEAARKLTEFGVCHAFPADISSRQGREQLVTRLAEREQALDVLVNNAGALWAAPLADYPEASLPRRVR